MSSPPSLPPASLHLLHQRCTPSDDWPGPHAIDGTRHNTTANLLLNHRQPATKSHIAFTTLARAVVVVVVVRDLVWLGHDILVLQLRLGCAALRGGPQGTLSRDGRCRNGAAQLCERRAAREDGTLAAGVDDEREREEEEDDRDGREEHVCGRFEKNDQLVEFGDSD